jgi:broad specificity phosphatase PhoE
MTMFHLLRHGEHMLLGRIAAGRMPGVGLSPKGRAQVEAVAERLAPEPIDALYSSPLQRTRETAEILSLRLQLPVQLCEGVIELDFGDWTGMTFDMVRTDPRWEAWRDARAIARLPGGETMREVQNRAIDALLGLEAQYHGGSVVVVSHGDVIRAILLFALGMPLDLYARLEVGVASLTTIQLEPARLRVLRVNERPR